MGRDEAPEKRFTKPIKFKPMSSIKIKGNGNFVFQSHSGSGDNIAGNKIQINHNTMNNNQQIQDAISCGNIDRALEILDTFSKDSTLLMSRWSALKREKMLGIIDFSNEQMQRNRIVAAILSAAGCDTSATTQPVTAAHSSNWESALLQIIKDNDRENTDNVKRARALLESFRSYYDLKRTRAFFDRSGEKLQEIETAFDDFKKSLSKSSNESVEKFIDKVAGLIDAKIPDWPNIKKAFILCLGRAGGNGSSLGSMQIEQLDRIIQNQPNDDEAKLRIVYAIETFLGQL